MLNFYKDHVSFFLCSGSVYELSGSEVCFSTGDLIKIIGLELHSVSCQDVSNDEKFELPINHKGWFEMHLSKMFSLLQFADFFSVFRSVQSGTRRDALQFARRDVEFKARQLGYLPSLHFHQPL